MKNAEKKKPYITEEEFNRITIERNIAHPEDDSKGDSATDDAVEAELGEHYAEGNTEGLDEIEAEDHGRTTVDTDREKIADQTSDETHSSTWPDASDIPA